MGNPDPGEEEAEVIVDLRHRPHGGAGIVGCRPLLDGDGRGEPLDGLHVGLVHLPDELSGISGKRLHIAPLPLGVDRVKGERRLSGAADAGDDDEFIPRDVEIDVLEVVLCGAFDPNGVHYSLISICDLHPKVIQPLTELLFHLLLIDLLPDLLPDGFYGLDSSPPAVDDLDDVKTDGRFDDAADLIQGQTEGDLLHFVEDHPLLDVADVTARGRGGSLGIFYGKELKRLAGQQPLVDHRGIRPEFLLRGRIDLFRQRKEDLLDPDGVLSLIILAVFAVILPDLLIADRHFGFDLPLDKPYPHQLIKDPFFIGLQGGSFPLQRLESNRPGRSSSSRAGP